MDKRTAKKIACYQAFIAIQAVLNAGNALDYEDSDKVEAALNELIEEMFRRSGDVAEDQFLLFNEAIKNGPMRLISK